MVIGARFTGLLVNVHVNTTGNYVPVNTKQSIPAENIRLLTLGCSTPVL